MNLLARSTPDRDTTPPPQRECITSTSDRTMVHPQPGDRADLGGAVADVISETLTPTTRSPTGASSTIPGVYVQPRSTTDIQRPRTLVSAAEPANRWRHHRCQRRRA